MANRRRFLGLAGTLGLFGACQSPEGTPSSEAPSRLGSPVSAYGERSRFETVARAMRTVKNPEVSSSRTPLASTHGVITPSSLHFERHHSGVPDIDPEKHRLVIHGLVERPMLFSVADLRRLPSVSRVYFVECSGNSGGEWGPNRGPTVDASHGLASCSEWTGVPLKTVLEEVGLQPEAKWLLAEGGDACRMSRSVPLEKALDDALVAYGQNGEAIRPSQGYPLRLILPGWEGNANVKWLHRILVGDQPFMTKDETSKYTELMPDGSAWQFTFAMDAKSVITEPSGGQTLPGPGFYEVRGLAWSGRGRIEKVEVSTDGGSTWSEALLQEPRFPKAFTRFRFPWQWTGQESTLLSRCQDDTGYLQPTVEELIATRGTSSAYHNNGQKAWTVTSGGTVGPASV
ncbi:MAG: sulfite dehydrogenase [Acidobacteria bacterium]|nr:sulfite dehydrogenase [Acidobacteriota bacterium]